MRKEFQVTFCFAVFGLSAFTSGQVTTSTGIANTVPKYSGAAAITNSGIVDLGTGVSIAEPLVVNGGSVSSGLPSFSVTGFQQYGIGIQFRLSNLTGLPESGSTSSILFTGGNRPNGFAMIQSGGTDYSGGNGFLAFQTTAGSVLTEAMRVAPSGYVGIGTTGPTSKLEVNGNITITHSSTGGVIFADGTKLTSAAGLNVPFTSLGTVTTGVWHATALTSTYLPADVEYIDTPQTISGKKSFSAMVGIGTTTPTNMLSVNGDVDLGTRFRFTNPNAYGGSTAVIGLNGTSGNKRFVFYDYISNLGMMSINDPAAGGGVLIGSGYISAVATPNAAPANGLAVQGNVGIGTTTPGAKLEINGSLKFTAGSGASVIFPDNTTQATAWNGVLSGGDYAESVNVSGNREEYTPGDVMVIDPDSEGNFLKSSAPYSTAVTGIYSTRPGVVGRRQRTARARMDDEVPMAMTGIVPVKVSAENGGIKPGDLLVTSSKAGYAMKGTDRSQMLGAVIGKAIGHLESGEGVIEAVVTLQ